MGHHSGVGTYTDTPDWSGPSFRPNHIIKHTQSRSTNSYRLISPDKVFKSGQS